MLTPCRMHGGGGKGDTQCTFPRVLTATPLSQPEPKKEEPRVFASSGVKGRKERKYVLLTVGKGEEFWECFR